ncbi:MAG TPA: thioredoxin family protein [Bacteroidales bacterium]|nr:thioredoxin family protein [Bacteroidales bacterium]
MRNIYSIEDLNEIILNEAIVVLYFSNEACNVCKILKPKINSLLEEKYSNVTMVYIDTEKSPAIAGQFRVFTIPTIDIYVEGKEHVRYSRNVIMHEFERAIEKPYKALFPEDTTN